MKATVAVFIALLTTQIGSAQSLEERRVVPFPIYPIVSLLEGNCLMGALYEGVHLSDAEARNSSELRIKHRELKVERAPLHYPLF